MRNCFIALLHAGLVLALTAILLSASASRAEAHGAGDDPGAEAVETGDAGIRADDACCHAQAGAHCSPLGAPPGALSFAGRQKTGVGGGEPPASRPLAAPAPGVPPPIRSAA